MVENEKKIFKNTFTEEFLDKKVKMYETDVANKIQANEDLRSIIESNTSLFGYQATNWSWRVIKILIDQITFKTISGRFQR